MSGDIVNAAVRGFCERHEAPKKTHNRKKAVLPHVALVFDTETTVDAAQRLTFGSYALYERDGMDEWFRSEPSERGLFYADGPGVPEDVPSRLRSIADATDPSLLVRLQTEFLELFFEIGYQQHGLIVAFNMPWDVSHIARSASLARANAKGGFSFLLWPKTKFGAIVRDKNGNVVARPFRPRVTVKSLGPHKASIRFVHTRSASEAETVIGWIRKKAHRIERGFIVPLWDERPAKDLGFVERGARALLDVPKPERANVERELRTAYLERHGHFEGRFLDLHVLGKALTDRSHSLRSACKAFDVKPKGEWEGEHPGWAFNRPYVAYNLNDTESTGELLNALLREYARHPIELEPDRAYSSASIGKAYMRALGITPPLERWPDFPCEMLGIAFSAYYGGRTTIGVRRACMPVMHTDFTSMYTTVNALLGSVELLRAKTVNVVDCTEDVTAFLRSIEWSDVFEPATWKRFSVFAEVELDGTGVFPVRAPFEEGDAPRIGMVYASSEQTAWYAGPDIVASYVMTGKRPKIRRAMRIEPERDSNGNVIPLDTLRKVDFMDTVPVDPLTDDIFARMIEERQRAKDDASLTNEERERLYKGLKVIALATGYGIYGETNVHDESDPEDVRVYTGTEAFDILTDAPELAGTYSFPPLACLTTAAAHLMLALLERCVRERGGTSVLEDTDSMAIVATEHGGIVPCPNGPETWNPPDGYRGPHAGEARGIRALSWADVAEIAEQFTPLSPYNRNAVRGSILKIEDINYRADGSQRQLYAYAISSKRYAMFELSPSGTPVFDFEVRDGKQKTQYSESGLGAISNPIDQKAGKGWIKDFWRIIVSDALGIAVERPAWFSAPAIAKMPISAPATWQAFDLYNAARTYDEGVKPFGFGLTARLERGSLRVPQTANMLEGDWRRHVADTAAQIRSNVIEQYEPYRRALASVGGRIVAATFAGRERGEYAGVLPRYKRRDDALPDGTLDLFVQVLQHELPGATENDALDFLRNPHTAMTWKRATELAERELAAFRPDLNRKPNPHPRLFAATCPPTDWLAQGDASPWFDAHTGRRYDITVGGDMFDPYATNVRVADYANLARVHVVHPEAKSACIDGSPCGLSQRLYCGPLVRRSITIGRVDVVGKESQYFEDAVAVALGELVEDTSDDMRGVLRLASEPVRELLGGLSSERVARAARTSRRLVDAVRDGRAPASSPDVNRIRKVARVLGGSPQSRDACFRSAAAAGGTSSNA